MNKELKITRDSGANLKILKELERKNIIRIYDVEHENETDKVKKKVLPVGVWGQTMWGKCLWAGNDCKYEKIRKIIGKENIGDAIKLEAHIRNKFDYFITEDRDFLDKQNELKKEFDIYILTPSELKNLLQPKNIV